MAELTTTQTPTPTEVTPTVVPVETPPVAVVARPVPGKPKSKDIRIPPAAFKERIRREANGQAKELLGMTLEEAAQRLRAAPAAAVASQGESTADAELIKLQAQIVRANKEAAAATKRAVDAENKAKKDARRLADAEVTAGLKLAAYRAGIGDTETDYVIHLFAKAVHAGQATNPTEFFGALKGTHPYLFTRSTSAPVPVEVPILANSAPRESTSPGEVKPTPAATGPNAAAPGIEKMSPSEFNTHMRSTYGYTPGM